MLFWIGILFAAIFAYFAVKIGFYEIWNVLFNIAVSIYLSIFLGPVIAEYIPKIDYREYIVPLSTLAAAIAAFLVLHSISFILFTGRFRVPFPKIIDTYFAGLWGFLTGCLIWSFIILLICMSPISQNARLKEFGFPGQLKEAKTSNVRFWCGLINTAVFSSENYLSTDAAIEKLNTISSKKDEIKDQNLNKPQPGMADPAQRIKRYGVLSDLTADVNDANN
jgi:hypothetical protein